MFDFITKRRKTDEDWSEASVFSELGRRELAEVEKLLKPMSKKAGDMVFSQDDPGDGLYIVASGSVSVFHQEKDDTHLKLTEIGTGSFFGEMALLSDIPRTASAVAAEDTDLLLLNRTDLLDLSEARPRIGVKIVMQLSQIVAERLRRTNRSLKEVRLEAETIGGEA